MWLVVLLGLDTYMFFSAVWGTYSLRNYTSFDRCSAGNSCDVALGAARHQQAGPIVKR